MTKEYLELVYPIELLALLRALLFFSVSSLYSVEK